MFSICDIYGTADGNIVMYHRLEPHNTGLSNQTRCRRLVHVLNRSVREANFGLTPRYQGGMRYAGIRFVDAI